MVQDDLLFQPVGPHLDILYLDHLLSGHNHLAACPLLEVFELVLGHRLSLCSAVAFLYLLSNRHNILAVEGNSGSAVDSRFLCLLHSYPDSRRCSLAHIHYRSPRIHSHLADIDHRLAEGTVAVVVEAGHSLAEARVAVQHARCMAVQEVDSSLDRRPLSKWCWRATRPSREDEGDSCSKDYQAQP